MPVRELRPDEEVIVPETTMWGSAKEYGGAVAQGAGYGAAESVGSIFDLARQGAAVPPPETIFAGRRAQQAFESIPKKPEFSATETLTAPFTKPGEVQTELRPGFEFGRSLGGQAPFVVAGGGVKTATSGVKEGAKLVGMEALPMGASSAARGAAASMGTDDELILALAEAGGGLAGAYGPSGLATKFAPALLRKSTAFVRQRFGEGAARREAGAEFRRVLKKEGEDIPALQAQLRAGEAVPGVKFTAAQKTLNDTLIAIESQLYTPEALARAETGLRENIRVIDEAVESAMKTGDPQLMKAALELRKAKVLGYAEQRVKLAERDAKTAAAQFDQDTTAGRRQANLRAEMAVVRARDDAIDVRKKLWAAMPDVPVEDTGSLAATWARWSKELLPGEPTTRYAGTIKQAAKDVPAPTEMGFDLGQFKQWAEAELGEKVPELTSGVLSRLYSKLRRDVRLMRGDAAPDRQRIQVLNDLANAIVQDLNKIPEVAEPFNVAREFSRQMADHFERGYVGRVLAMSPVGERRMRPVQTIEEAIKPGEFSQFETTENLRDLRKGAAFKGDETGAITPDAARAAEMQRAEQEVLQSVARNVLDETGHVDLAKLRRYRDTYGDALQDFPDLRAALDSAETAQRYFENVVGIASRGTKTAGNLKHLGTLMKVDNPVAAMKSAIGDPEKVDSYFRMAAKTPEGKAGARAALLEALFDLAKRPMGADRPDLISGLKMQVLLHDNDLIGMAKRRGILDDTHIEAIEKLSGTAKKLEDYLSKQYLRTDERIEPMDLGVDLLARLVGANLGGHGVVAQSTGASLVMASAGSRMARRVLERSPRQRVKDIMIEAMENPQLLADLLGPPPQTAKEATEWGRRINAHLLHAGIISADDLKEKDDEEQ